MKYIPPPRFGTQENDRLAKKNEGAFERWLDKHTNKPNKKRKRR